MKAEVTSGVFTETVGNRQQMVVTSECVHSPRNPRNLNVVGVPDCPRKGTVHSSAEGHGGSVYR